MKNKYYVTTAIAYPNGRPHMGHALEIIQADVIARFHRLLGKDVVFQTGTDEHGVKNWETAKKQGKDILTFLDENVAVFKELYKQLDISNDLFIRTSDKKIHYPGAQKLWAQLVKAGDIYKQKYKGLYCVGCESFKTEKELVDGKCPNHPTRDIQTIEEENYFFKLSKYKDELIDLIKKDKYEVIPETRKNEILSFLKQAKDISFSRPKINLPWGVPVPDDEEHVMYVWCDALSNYITGIGYSENEKQFKTIWPADIHVIGKDILKFHAAFWPAMLLSAKLPTPKKLFVHGFVLLKGAKMGKSSGNVVEPFEQLDKFGINAFRFYLLGSMPIDSDGDYSEEAVIERNNTELVANLSNFCYRTLSFTKKNFNSEIKIIDYAPAIKEIESRFNHIRKSYEDCNFKEALKLILEVSHLGNKYFQDKEPWKLIKEYKDKANAVLATCVNIAKNLSILIEPIMPKFSRELQKQLGVKNQSWKDLNFDLKNHKIKNAEIIEKNIELEETKTFPLNLKVGKITEIKDHPDSDNLYILKVNIGEERQLVAGLRPYIKTDQLLNKNIVVVTNLKPAKFRGVESQGMLLAAQNGDNVKPLQPKGNPGDRVYIDDHDNNQDRVKIDVFKTIKFKVKNKKILVDNLALKTASGDVTVDIEDGAKVC